MKKIGLFLMLFLFLPLVLGQTATSNTASIDKIIEKAIVKEHYTTRLQLQDYIDKKSVEYSQEANAMIENAFEEIDVVIDRKMQKFIFKISLGMGSAIFFFSSLWYLVFIYGERKRRKIEELNRVDLSTSKPLMTETIPEAEKPVQANLNPVNEENKVVPEVPIYQKPKQDFQSRLETEELLKRKKSLISEWKKVKEELNKAENGTKR